MVHSASSSVRPLLPFSEGGSSASAGGGAVDERAAGIREATAGEDEEARHSRVVRRPQVPTTAEVKAHMTTHAEYRDWCPDCVHGRGVSHQHKSSQGEKMGREFSLDCAFMTAEEIG